jgi:tape measure domain-containing protein
MATTIGKLAFLVVADSSGVTTGLATGQSAILRFGSSVSSMMTRVSALLGGASLAGFAGWGVKLAAEFEQAQTGFEVFLGSAEKARDLLAEMLAFSIKSPLNMPELQRSALTLLQYGAAGEDVMSTMRQLGDVARGNADRFQLLTLAMSQVISKSRLQGSELRQLTESGFNPLAVIAEQTGMSIGELIKVMEAGGISTKHVMDALKAATSEGGRFFGMLEKQAQTLGGRWATLKETTGLLAMEMAEALMPAMKGLVEVGISTVGWLKDLNISTVKNIIGITSITAAFLAGAAAGPRLIAAIMGIVTALRNLAVGQSIVMALGGPKGIIQLAVGTTAAIAASVAVNELFISMASATNEVTEEVTKAGEAVKVFDASMFQAANNGVEAMKEQLAGLKDELTAAEKKYDQLRRGIEAGRNAFVGAAERGTMAEFEARFRGGQEGIIQRELQALHEMEEKELGAIRDRVRDVESAIKAKETIEVTEARI